MTTDSPLRMVAATQKKAMVILIDEFLRKEVTDESSYTSLSSLFLYHCNPA